MPKQLPMREKLRNIARTFIEDEAMESENESGENSDDSTNTSIYSEDASCTGEKNTGKGRDEIDDQDSCHIYYGSGVEEKRSSNELQSPQTKERKHSLQGDGDNCDMKPAAKKRRYYLDDTDSSDDSTTNRTAEDDLKQSLHKISNALKNDKPTDEHPIKHTQGGHEQHISLDATHVNDKPNHEGEPQNEDIQVTIALGTKQATEEEAKQDNHVTTQEGERSVKPPSLLRVTNPYIKKSFRQSDTTEEKQEQECNITDDWDDPNEVLSDELLEKMKIAEAEFEKRKLGSKNGKISII